MNKLMQSIKEACSFLDYSLSEDPSARIIFLGVVLSVLLFWIFGAMYFKSGFKNIIYFKFCIILMILFHFALGTLSSGFIDERNNFYDMVAIFIINFLFVLFYILILSIIYLYIKKYSYKAEDFIDQV